MGLFDSIAGQALGALGGAVGGAAGGQQAGLIEAIGGLINNPQTGGLQGLVSTFEAKGLGGVMASWIGTGQNLPISAEQLQSVLGSTQVQAIAQQLGFSPQELLPQLAQLLPQVIDKLTPGGQVPDAGALGGLLGMLKGVGI